MTNEEKALANQEAIILEGKLHNKKIKFTEETFCPMINDKCNIDCVCLGSYIMPSKSLVVSCHNYSLTGE